MSKTTETESGSFEWSVREFVFRTLAETGKPPSCHDASAALHCPVSAAEDTYRRLNDRHAIFLQPGTLDIRMAHPFAGVATEYQVHAKGVDYWANCAWDMLGIPAALHADAEISAPETDTGGQIEMSVSKEHASGWDGSIHFSVPFRHWYDDLVHT